MQDKTKYKDKPNTFFAKNRHADRRLDGMYLQRRLWASELIDMQAHHLSTIMLAMSYNNL